jgi:hypothetical protein
MASTEVRRLPYDLVVMPGKSDLSGGIAAFRLFHALSVSYQVQYLQISITAPHILRRNLTEIFQHLDMKMSGTYAAKGSLQFAPHVCRGRWRRQLILGRTAPLPN